MKKLLFFCFTITLLNSCFPRLELDTNFYLLEICNDTILNPSYYKPKRDSIVTDLYLTDSTIIMTYNNRYRRTIRPTKIKFMSSRIMFYINDDLEYEIFEINGNLYFSKWGYWYKMIPQSSKTALDKDFPTYNQIQTYLNNFEIKGNVRRVEKYTYESKIMFGKDTLLLKRKYEYDYNKKGSVTDYRICNDVKSSPQYLYILRYVYNQLNQLYLEYHEVPSDNDDEKPFIRWAEYKYNENNLISSFSKLSRHDEFIYDDYLRLKEYNEFYDDRLIRKTKFSYNNNLRKGVVYNGFTGKEIGINIYNSDNSLIKGWDKEYFVNTTVSIENTTVSKEYGNPFDDGYHKTLCKYDKDKNVIYNDETLNKQGKEIRHIYRYSYEYDQKGNWIKRKQVCIFSSDKNEEGEIIIDLRGIIYWQ